MLKKTIKYIDYDGNEREEEFHFNLSKAEVAQMQFETTGGLERLLRRIVNERDVPKIISIFKDLIVRSYGKVSDDGRRFIKSKELCDEFMQTEAFSNLYVEFLQDPEKLVVFVEGILPKDLSAEFAKGIAESDVVAKISE